MTQQQEKLTREEMAKIEVGHTEISGRAAWALIGLFIVTIAIVPASQFFWEINARLDGLRHSALPQALDIFRAVPEAAQRLGGSDRPLPSRVFRANAAMLRSINQYEDDLEDASLLQNLVLSPVQAILTELGAGNEEAYLGAGQWIYYRPGFDYVTGPGFLDPDRLAKRASGGNEWQTAPQPDPILAIDHFSRRLAQRGIRLIVMPAPVKPAIHPEHLDGTSRAPVQNPSYEEFLSEVESRGVLVYDPAPAIAAAKFETGHPQYLATDTHWRPEAMELAAQGLAEFIRSGLDASDGPSVEFRRETAEITNMGDIVTMLKLPPNQRIYRKETVTISQVLSPGGEMWRPSRTADILLLGDSFNNIYSLEPMGWGASAGLAEQLSYHLGRPVDVIARNDSGAYATREMLSRELARGRDRLAGKRAVVWEFAARELAAGDWKIIEMKLGEPRPATFLALDDEEHLDVTGTIADISAVPKPHSVPYKDHIVSIHLVDIAAGRPIQANEALVYMWSMRDNIWTGAARYRAGQEVSLRLSSWYAVEDRLGAIRRSELPDDDLALEDPCWGEEQTPQTQGAKEQP